MPTAVGIAFLLVYVLGAFAYGSALILSLRQASPVWSPHRHHGSTIRPRLDRASFAMFLWSAVWFVVLALDQFDRVRQRSADAACSTWRSCCSCSASRRSSSTRCTSRPACQSGRAGPGRLGDPRARRHVHRLGRGGRRRDGAGLRPGPDARAPAAGSAARWPRSSRRPRLYSAVVMNRNPRAAVTTQPPPDASGAERPVRGAVSHEPAAGVLGRRHGVVRAGQPA